MELVRDELVGHVVDEHRGGCEGGVSREEVGCCGGCLFESKHCGQLFDFLVSMLTLKTTKHTCLTGRIANELNTSFG